MYFFNGLKAHTCAAAPWPANARPASRQMAALIGGGLMNERLRAR
jgi:hypothetical protein